MNFEQILEIATEIMMALKLARKENVGDDQVIPVPPIEIAYKGAHYQVTGMEIVRVK